MQKKRASDIDLPVNKTEKIFSTLNFFHSKRKEIQFLVLERFIDPSYPKTSLPEDAFFFLEKPNHIRDRV